MGGEGPTLEQGDQIKSEYVVRYQKVLTMDGAVPVQTRHANSF